MDIIIWASTDKPFLQGFQLRDTSLQPVSSATEASLKNESWLYIVAS